MLTVCISGPGRNVLDLHGSLQSLECTRCGHQTTATDYSKLTLPPRCEQCDGLIRPRVVLFEEELPYDKLSRLWYELGAGFDLIFSIGTSSMFEYIVEPVRAGRRMGTTTIEINPEMTTISSDVDIKISARAATVLSAIWERYLTWWPMT